jgi:predicted RNA-binding Zn ribbon-like protein
MGKLRVRKPWTEVLEPAPPDLDVLQAFLNSWDRLVEHEELDSPQALAAWLVRWRLASEKLELTEDDLEHVLRVREALLGLAQCNAGIEVPEWITTRLDRAAVDAPVQLRFQTGGTALFQPSKEGLAGALGRLLLLVARAQRDGQWSRLKTCRGKECRRVFYDSSPNRSRIWCSKDLCGGRYQMRAIRRRQKHRSRW